MGKTDGGATSPLQHGVMPAWVNTEAIKRRKLLVKHFVRQGVESGLAELIAERTKLEKLGDKPDKVCDWIQTAFVWVRQPENGDDKKAYFFWSDVYNDLAEKDIAIC